MEGREGGGSRTRTEETSPRLVVFPGTMLSTTGTSRISQKKTSTINETEKGCTQAIEEPYCKERRRREHRRTLHGAHVCLKSSSHKKKLAPSKQANCKRARSKNYFFHTVSKPDHCFSILTGMSNASLSQLAVRKHASGGSRCPKKR